MKLVVYGPNRLGCLLEDGSIVDLNLSYTALLDRRGVARPYAHACSQLPADLLGFIKEEEPAIRAAEEAVSFVGGGGVEGPRGERLVFNPGEVKVRAPLPSFASRIAMAGANFYSARGMSSAQMSPSSTLPGQSALITRWRSQPSSARRVRISPRTRR